MQIHELNRKRPRTDEGFMDVAKSVGSALKQSVAPGANTAKSAGILDPNQKLAAVMKEPAMVKLATQYADEWVQQQGTTVQEAEVAEPGTYNKRTGAAKLGGKTMTALSDLPPHIQQQIQAKQDLEKQTGRPNPYMTPAAQQPAPATAQRFNYNNVSNMPGVANATAPAQPQPTTGSQVHKANPDNPNIKDQTKYVQGRAGTGTGGDATKFAKYDPATSAMANAEQGINNMARGGVAAQQQATPAKPTGTAMPTTPYQVPGAGTNPNPTATKPGQTTAPAKTTGTTMPTKPFQVPGAGTNPNPTATKPATQTTTAQQQAPADPKYVTDFLKWANQKVAMRDSATYRTLGLADAEKSELKPQLDAAKQAVVKAQGDPASTKEAVKNYILTALAALQLTSSKNTVAAASAKAPAYGSQGAEPGEPAAGQAGQGQPIDIKALAKAAGLDPAALAKAGPVMQKATGGGALTSTGDDAVDGLLQLMGYKVS